MTDAENHRLGDYVETSAGGEHVRAYMPAQLPPKPPLELGRFMRVSERAIAALVAYRRLTKMCVGRPTKPQSKGLANTCVGWRREHNVVRAGERRGKARFHGVFPS